MDPSGYTVLIWSEIIFLKLGFSHVVQFCCVGSACRGLPHLRDLQKSIRTEWSQSSRYADRLEAVLEQ
jgi:hypothetical protein